MKYLSNPHTCRLARTANLFVTTTTVTTVAWDVEVFDPYNLHVNTNLGQIKINAAGLYLVVGSLAWTPLAAVGDESVGIAINGTVIAYELHAVAINDFGRNCITRALMLAKDDFVEIVAYQTSGATVQVSGPTPAGTEFSVSRIH